MLQTIQGRRCYVVVIDQDPTSLLPISDGGDPSAKLYAEALDDAIRTRVITEPGKYAIELYYTGLPYRQMKYNIYTINE